MNSVRHASVSVADEQEFAAFVIPDLETSVETGWSIEDACLGGPSGLKTRVSSLLGRRLATLSERHAIVVDADTPLWLGAALRRLQQLTQLPDDWDGYGSPPVGQNDARLAQAFLEHAGFDIPEPTVVPYQGGGLQIEWSTNDCYLEIDVNAVKRQLFVLFESREAGVCESVISESMIPLEAPRVLEQLRSN